MANKINIEKLVRENIKNLAPYSSARDEFSGKEGVFLDANENPFGDVNRYPDPYQIELKKKVSEIKKIPVENIFFGNGSDEVIDLIYRIFAEPKQDEALIFTPTYGMYEVSANINNITLNKLSLNSDFQININSELNNNLKNKNLKIILICSPNNPSGNLLNEDAVLHILNNFKGIVVIDEAYIDFSKNPSWIQKINDFENLIVMQTFSKYWGMAGLRVGMCFAGKEIISLMNKVKPPYNISVLNQKKVLKKLRNPKKISKNLKILLSELQLLKDDLLKLNFVKKIFPTDANFLLVEVSDANKIYDYLVEKNIIVRNRNSVINNCLRITVGTPKENKKLMKALKNFAENS